MPILTSSPKKRLLIFVVAYNAEKTIATVLSRIPLEIASQFEVEVLIIDDFSLDKTYQQGVMAKESLALPFNITILRNPINQGYGGNQKIGYHYAMQYNFDYVALIHGDGQYAPEALPDLMKIFSEQQTDAVFGSRMLFPGAARKGGMPFYKLIGNKILTRVENLLLGTKYSEFHSGYRIYAVNALRQIPFDLNTNDFHFDTEIIIQFVAKGLTIVEYPIPTYYGDEICHVNGMKYALDVVRAVLRYRLQQLGIFYDRRFDLVAPKIESNAHYQAKFVGTSPHTVTFKKITANAKVIDMGCAAGYIGVWLQNERQCTVLGVDQYAHPGQLALNYFTLQDLSKGLPEQLPFKTIDYILLLDVIEHLADPEQFVSNLAKQLGKTTQTQVLVSTGNVAFIVIRLMLMLGQFNYGKRGILDRTHTRLFTFASLRHLLEQAGFEIVEEQGIPVPMHLICGSKRLASFLEHINLILIKLSKGLFSFQMYMVVKPKPSLEYLLIEAQNHAAGLIGTHVRSDK